jgi:ATP-dependent Clp protease ATP-binding subunit ClpB
MPDAIHFGPIVIESLAVQGPASCEQRCPQLICGLPCAAQFINRLDKIVVFNSLGNEELRRIVDIELDVVQERIQTAAASKPFLVDVTESAREFLLMEGTDLRYGARPLKRAIERLLVQPVSNLMASGQIQRGDYIRVTHGEGSPSLLFFRETRTLEAWGITDRAAA